MLTYMQVHLYFLFPPTLFLIALYYPLIGRRDILIVAWLCLMATIYTTAWDNWIISQAGWGYPEGSIIGKIFFVPIEEHIFFVVQPIALVALHSLFTHPRLLNFALSTSMPQTKTTITVSETKNGGLVSSTKMKEVVQTLPRRPLASLLWVGVFALGGVLVNEAHGTVQGVTPGVLQYGKQAFYLGWILLWISPVVGWLTWLGANPRREAWKAWAIGSALMCAIDTTAIRAGAWTISPETSLDIQVIRGLPLEEFIFFLLTSWLVILGASLITHLHTLLILSPELPPCPPLNPALHVALLGRVVLHPPLIDRGLLEALVEAENTLRKGSKSFDVAKLAFGREMRTGLVAIYAWCRVTDNLIDEPESATPQTHARTLATIRKHLKAAYSPDPKDLDIDTILNDIPHLSSSDRSAFHLFASLIPRLVPIEPFLELCKGYETDMAFLPSTPGSTRSPLTEKMRDPAFDIEKHLPIRTTDDLLRYADDVAGSIASAICYLSWSILTSPINSDHTLRPVDALTWSRLVHYSVNSPIKTNAKISMGLRTVRNAREMGRALQLVNISRDIAKDAIIARLYVPLSLFPSPKTLLSILLPSSKAPPPSYAPYSTALLDIADRMRVSSIPAIGNLPRTARGGTRAMAASYFEIAEAIRRNKGEVDEKGIKVDRWRRGLAAAKAFWLGIA